MCVAGGPSGCVRTTCPDGKGPSWVFHPSEPNEGMESA